MIGNLSSPSAVLGVEALDVLACFATSMLFAVLSLCFALMLWREVPTRRDAARLMVLPIVGLAIAVAGKLLTSYAPLSWLLTVPIACNSLALILVAITAIRVLRCIR